MDEFSVQDYTTEQSQTDSLKVSVAPLLTESPCKYRYTFRMNGDIKQSEYYVLTFELPEGFGDPQNLKPANNAVSQLSETPPGTSKYTWKLKFPESASYSESYFDVYYTGDAGMPVFANSNKVTWESFKNNKPDKSGTFTSDDKTTNTCSFPCCEDCNGGTIDEVPLKPCDNYAEYDKNVIVQPSGRKISVNLKLPKVCDTKDVVVGVYLYEVINEKEVPYAHKVILRPAASKPTGECVEDRDCNCVDFFIYDTDVCPEFRKFVVRTKAHQLDNKTTDNCTCACKQS